jgi:hypothetical protein
MSNEFFGHRTSLPIGAALLAIDTGDRYLPVHLGMTATT